MAIQRTRWEPDTHPGTIIEYEWDDSLPDDQRVHTVVDVVQPGSGRAAAGLRQALYDRVLSHNQRKNQGLAEVVAVNSAWVDRTTWALNADTGVVTVFVTGLTTAQRNTVTARLAAKFGATVVLG